MTPEMRGEGTVYRQKGSRFFWIQYYIKGEPVRESSKSESPKAARKLLSQRIAAIESGERSLGGKIKLSELYDALERDYVINRRKDLVNLKTRWALHLKPAFGDKCVSEVDSETIARYVTGRLSDEASNASINRELSNVKRMFKLAVQSGKLKIGQQPYIQMLKERNVRKGFLPDELYDPIARETAAVGLWFRAIMEVGYNHGWRKSELLTRRVRHFDAAQRRLYLDPGETKNGEPRWVPLVGAEFELIQQCCSGKSSEEFIFTRDKDRRGRKPRTPYVRDYRDDWAAVCCKLALGAMFCASCRAEIKHNSRSAREAFGKSPKGPDETVCAGCGSTGELSYRGLIFHDFRRTASNNLIRAGLSEKQAMAHTGHLTNATFKRYHIVDPKQMEESRVKIEQAARDRHSRSEYDRQQQGIDFSNIEPPEQSEKIGAEKRLSSVIAGETSKPN
jgi:integrase